IEHDMDLIAQLCDTVIVMSEGKTLAQGTLDEIKRDDRVLQAYLGGQYDENGGGLLPVDGGVVLETRDIVTGYGEVEVLHGVSVWVSSGEMVAVIGPNGAGKSTLLKAIFGLLPAQAGTVLLNGADVTGKPPDALVQNGLSYVPQV